ncbi:oligosaccharide flippase family protein [Mucilaginibacter sp. HMF5004]|uniref:oligosaccharide flippase family protein n=1 Tax=Mucilaginibacter rivuli TaxID=2857527 RepID=UPI001C5F4567|nr:oligosaccharide flippase family protein [Mucilaginibacter rivuli]MBW4888685.1 oligosaccharide flippase family protein [Mucilaginibacter rivuli]
MSTAKKFAGQTAIYGLSTILSRSLNFILTYIYVKVYPAKIYGIFTNMYSWASMLNAILSFGMETTFFRYLTKHEKDKDKVYSNSFIAILSMAVVFLLFTVLFVDGIAQWMRGGEDASKIINNNAQANFTDYVSYVKCFIYILVVDALCVIPFAKVRADGRPIRFGTIKLLNILFFVGLNLFAIYGVPFIISHNLPGGAWMQQWFRPGWIGYVFYANLIASIITFLMLLPELLKLKFSVDGKMLKEMLFYSWPILIANISFILNENLDKVMLKHLLPAAISDQQVGIYGACAKISLFLSIFVQAFRLGAEPFFFSHAKNKNSGETYARIMNYFVITVALIFVALVTNIEILKYFISNRNPAQQAIYWSGLGVVPPLLFGYVSLGIYMNLSVWYKLSDQTKYGLYISGVGAILTVVLNWIFIPKYSYMASAWVSLIAYASMMILSYLWGQKNYPIPYNVKKNVTYIIASIVIVILSFYVFNRNIFIGNGLLILFALAAFFAERKELMLILKRK